jgi:ectoine hydroxylase-related dioxygenase (phytanoyl-CoA dioxygenase family)
VISAHYIPYETERFPLARAAAEALGVDRLDSLAETERERKRQEGKRPRLGYRDNMRLRAHLAGLEATHPLLVLYNRLVYQVVAPAFGYKISYTASPTFRVHMAGTPSVSDWHRDADVTGRLDYLTGWVPFVDTFESNALWVEQHYGAGDYCPIPAAYGEIVIFDGAMARHGSQPNKTCVSRVSLDFRFVPKNSHHRGPIADSILAGRENPQLVTGHTPVRRDPNATGSASAPSRRNCARMPESRPGW